MTEACRQTAQELAGEPTGGELLEKVEVYRRSMGHGEENVLYAGVGESFQHDEDSTCSCFRHRYRRSVRRSCTHASTGQRLKVRANGMVLWVRKGRRQRGEAEKRVN